MRGGRRERDRLAKVALSGVRVEVAVDDCSNVTGDNHPVNLALSSAQLHTTHAPPAALVQPAQLVGGTQTCYDARLDVSESGRELRILNDDACMWVFVAFVVRAHG